MLLVSEMKNCPQGLQELSQVRLCGRGALSQQETENVQITGGAGTNLWGDEGTTARES